MSTIPRPISEFLDGRRIAVAGVARDGQLPANLILRKLRDGGREVIPINPNASELEGTRCYPDLASIPGEIDGVVIATHPAVSPELVRQCGDKGVKRVWFHRSFGDGSVSEEAIRECERLGIEPIVGGCPMMYAAPVDLGHRCMRWILGWRGRLPRATES
ncbi:MAG: CoA-binding protein [Thermoanaerobaculia bacterium]